jgi:predicted DCC family thiol-disulfide oxidoreductase YuxK
MPRRPLLIFDGDCGFCTASAAWIAAQWAGPAQTVPWQQLGPEGLAPFGLTTADTERAVYWVAADGAVSRGHRAVGRALQAARRRRLRVAGTALLVPPLSWLGRPGYWLVARYRSRLPGSTPACRPGAGESSIS